MRAQSAGHRRSRIILVAIIILTTAVIWGHSMMPQDVSSEESSFVMKLLLPVLELFAGRGNVTEHFVRKLGHFTEYMILGGEISWLLFSVLRDKLQKKGRWQRSIAAFALCIVWTQLSAFLDETIQIFSGRGPMISDVWIDVAGAATGAILIILIRNIAEYVRDRKQ